MEQAGQEPCSKYIFFFWNSGTFRLQVLKPNPKCFKKLKDSVKWDIFRSWRKLPNFHMQAQTLGLMIGVNRGTEKQRTIIFQNQPANQWKHQKYNYSGNATMWKLRHVSDRNQLCEVCLKAKAGQSCSEAAEESTNKSVQPFGGWHWQAGD